MNQDLKVEKVAAMQRSLGALFRVNRTENAKSLMMIQDLLYMFEVSKEDQYG